MKMKENSLIPHPGINYFFLLNKIQAHIRDGLVNRLSFYKKMRERQGMNFDQGHILAEDGIVGSFHETLPL
jgi:hypothetical protein